MRPSKEQLREIDESVDEREALRLSRDLIRIPSVYGKEHKLSRRIQDILDRWGLHPRRVPVKGFGPDVLATHGADGRPSIVFNGHMDTVEVMDGWKHDPFGAKVEDGWLYGLGSLDMKCGLACLMLAFRTLAETRLLKNTQLRLQAVSAEEYNCAGTLALISRGEYRRAKAVIVGEGFGGPMALTIGRRGGAYYDIDVQGRASHAATPYMGVNAVSDASRIVAALDSIKLRKSKRATGDDFRPLTEAQTVLRISGGTDSLSVPEACRILVYRSTIPDGPRDVSEELEDAIRSTKPRSRVKLSLRKGPGEWYYPHMEDPNSELVRAAFKSVRQYSGKSPKMVCGVSEADDNVISRYAKVPVICFGPGESGARARYHQAEESISVEQLGMFVKIYCATALRLAN
jgi:acetylornithine deacetylase/succinyl-diaminopimelate desuccinylase family protein